MIDITLADAATWMNATLLGDQSYQSLSFKGVSTDSRTVSPGDLYVAIPGERVDGHDFIEQAKARGASAALVSKSIKIADFPLLQVEDTVLALGQLGKQYAKQFQLPMASVTGSCGKTTVKEMLASILSVKGPILASKGNLNTEVGVPITLLGLEPEHRYGVIEMGARKKGDIRYLMGLVSPDVTLITNAGVAHIEIFGSESGIAEAKGEIFACLKPEGTAVINWDEPKAEYWKSLLTTQKVITFGFASTARPYDLTCRSIEYTKGGSKFELITPKGSLAVELQAPGSHSISNALAAAAVAVAMGLSLSEIKQGLNRFSPVTGRLQFKRGLQNSCIMDDTYNANPVSVKAALAVLAGQKGDTVFVMGDMLELGAEAVTLHKAMGEEAKRLGIQKLFGIGTLTRAAIDAFGPEAKHFQDKTHLINELRLLLNSNTTVLVKGSRGMRMEEIVQGLLETSKEDNAC